ncbi:hypothetical protein MA16_Dca014382 [Dendrobium catenatum]|uniref:Uncharacterized protein n=1 Tax=Dendrobium catenatum TaxID=906689 RepID=A0A2I0WWI2_9ASPA|nr:hypothetical protein MA16_Dca014382 [Dendrobium catenatum]
MFSGSFGVLSLCLRHRCIVLRFQAFSAASSHTSSSRDSNSSKKELLLTEEAATRLDAYRELQNLNFKSAAKILFTKPPKGKKLDFHLVQLFFACLPSLAVYLVAQYARSEIRRMEAEVEKKKKETEEKERVKDAEVTPTKEEPNKELSEVKTRLDALEEAVKEIVDEKRKIIDTEPNSTKNARNVKLESAVKNSENQNEAEGVGGSSSNIQNGKFQHKDAEISWTSTTGANK